MKNISVIYFSPTGGTRKASVALGSGLASALMLDPAQAMDPEPSSLIRETDLCTLDGPLQFGPEDIVVVGMPVFGGRLPGFAAERLRYCQGNGAVAVTGAVYGNRAFEDALLELDDCLRDQGFRIAAGTALLAEHSMVRDIAAGRPDDKDLEDIQEFAGRIYKKLQQEGWQEPQVPGNRPYRDWKQMPVVPLTGDACTGCGLCAENCPTKAIPPDAPDTTMGDRCILCMRCISVCPQRARSLPPQAMAMLGQKLAPVRDIRKGNELFL